MDFPLKILFKTAINASPSIGLASNIIFIKSIELFTWNIIPTNNAPKKVLPTSPMKIFDGLQLKNIKPIKSAIIDHKLSFKPMANVAKIMLIVPAKSPSRPSTKFIKFIKPVQMNIIKTKFRNIKKVL